jgi:hypothetical protein
VSTPPSTPAETTTTATASTATAADRVPRAARVFVLVLLAVFLVGPCGGVEGWPITRWRLFSANRHATDTRWQVQSVGADGSATTVSLEELPLAYRHAEWPLADLPKASEARRQEVCEALAPAVAEAHPGTLEVALVKDEQELVQRSQGWQVIHHVTAVTSCAVPEGST